MSNELIYEYKLLMTEGMVTEICNTTTVCSKKYTRQKLQLLKNQLLFLKISMAVYKVFKHSTR